jgi:hypothetical protein
VSRPSQQAMSIVSIHPFLSSCSQYPTTVHMFCLPYVLTCSLQYSLLTHVQRLQYYKREAKEIIKLNTASCSTIRQRLCLVGFLDNCIVLHLLCVHQIHTRLDTYYKAWYINYKRYTKLPQWCSKHNIYKYFIPHLDHLWIGLFIWLHKWPYK